MYTDLQIALARRIEVASPKIPTTMFHSSRKCEHRSAPNLELA
jgi:hypothetical protein